MQIRLRFNLEAWIKQLDIDATSEEEAIEIVKGMSLEEIVEKAFIRDFNISEVETSIENYDLEVSITNITYDLDSNEMDAGVIQYLESRLPTELTATFNGISDYDDVEDLVRDSINFQTGYNAASFDFEVIEKR